MSAEGVPTIACLEALNLGIPSRLHREFALRRQIHKNTSTSKLILSYNAPLEFRRALGGCHACKRDWVPILADANSTKEVREIETQASGVIYLSWHSFNESPLARKYHFDGGVESPMIDSNWRPSNGRKVVVYAGALTEYGGVFELLEAWKKLKFSGLELWIFGPSPSRRFREALKLCERVIFKGQVPDFELAAAFRHADLFVNPRPTDVEASLHNFPSKLHDYLRWGKPVVTTLTGGLSPEYSAITVGAQNSSVHCLAEAIMYSVQMPAGEQLELRKRIASWISNSSWDKRVRQLSTWIKEGF
jgi:glycosyltransferase involved in cell wall biosynthesis